MKNILIFIAIITIISCNKKHDNVEPIKPDFDTLSIKIPTLKTIKSNNPYTYSIDTTDIYTLTLSQSDKIIYNKSVKEGSGILKDKVYLDFSIPIVINYSVNKGYVGGEVDTQQYAVLFQRKSTYLYSTTLASKQFTPNNPIINQTIKK